MNIKAYTTRKLQILYLIEQGCNDTRSIAEKLGLNKQATDNQVWRLKDAGAIEKTGFANIVPTRGAPLLTFGLTEHGKAELARYRALFRDAELEAQTQTASDIK